VREGNSGGSVEWCWIMRGKGKREKNVEVKGKCEMLVSVSGYLGA